VQTGIGMMDHMLEQLAKHGLFDITVEAQATSSAISPPGRRPRPRPGQALNQALASVVASPAGHAVVPMDESLVPWR
jgi:imidazoleglycerol-phosphate dehydratase